MTQTHLKELGDAVQKLRKKRGLTQQQFARKLKTTQSAVARIEKGEHNISTSTLSRINHALKANLVHLDPGSLTIRVEGGKKLRGSVRTNTSKNGAVGLLCASLLNKGRTVLKDVPRIEEVFRIIEVLESIGVTVHWSKNTLTITTPKRFSLKSIDTDAATKTRSIVMFMGPLSGRMDSFPLPKVGGCKLGTRSIKPHIYALEELGIRVSSKNGTVSVDASKRHAGTVVLYESGDTVTENALMAAAVTPGVTTIKFASANYQVQDLCFFLEDLGVRIEGIGTSTLTVHGLSEIDKNVEYHLSEDPIESMFFIAAALVTNSQLTIERCPIEFLELELLKLEKMGLRYSRSQPYFAKNNRTALIDLTIHPSRLKALSEKIESRPFPGLNIDNLPFFAVIATQATGQTFIHDWVYEDRAIYLKELDKLGAQVILADPHRVYVTGRTALTANEIICPPALRPGAVILIAMLAAKGTSILRNIYSINRGYESLVERLNGLGASISFDSDM